MDPLSLMEFCIETDARELRRFIYRYKDETDLYTSMADYEMDNHFTVKYDGTDTDYKGCGIRCAQNVLQYFDIYLSQDAIKCDIPTHSIPGYPDNIWVYPDDLQKGLQKILDMNGYSGQIKVNLHNGVAVSKIIEYLKEGMPVIALVNGGSHWVSIFAWKDQIFYGYSNENQTYWPLSEISLGFSGGASFASAVLWVLGIPGNDHGYKEGTIITFYDNTGSLRKWFAPDMLCAPYSLATRGDDFYLITRYSTTSGNTGVYSFTRSSGYKDRSLFLIPLECDNSKWSFTFQDNDLFCITVKDNETPNTEVHILGQNTGYSNWKWHRATAICWLSEGYDQWQCLVAPNDDLVAIFKNLGVGPVEIHVMQSKGRNWQKFVLEAPTVMLEADNVHSFVMLDSGNIMAVVNSETSSGTKEVFAHIMWAEKNYQEWWRENIKTLLPQTSNDWVFSPRAHGNRLYAAQTLNTKSGYIEFYEARIGGSSIHVLPLIWVKRTTPPANAIVGGHISDTPHPVYIGRAVHGGNVHPGKVAFYDGHWSCFIGNGGVEQRYEDYEILCGIKPSSFYWSGPITNDLPTNAVVGGRICDTPNPVYVGRAYHGGNAHPGKVAFYDGHWSCFIGNGGVEQRYETYEVLCYNVLPEPEPAI